MKRTTIELSGYFKFANRFIFDKDVTTLAIPISNNKYALLQSTSQDYKQVCSVDQHYLDKAIKKSHRYATSKSPT